MTKAGIEVVIASSKIGSLKGISDGIVASELILDDVNVNNFDAIIFIGGPGTGEYFNSQAAQNIAKEAAAKRKVLAAISMAPTILANAGVLKGLRATGLINQREMIQKGEAKYTGAPVERDGFIITSNGLQAVGSFTQTIIAALNEKQSKPDKTPAK